MEEVEAIQPKSSRSKTAKAEPTVLEKVIESKIASEVGRTVVRKLTRGMLGVGSIAAIR